MSSRYLCLAFFLFVFTSLSVLAQTSVKGRITDALTKEPLPFANIIFTGTTVGTTSDFDGYYQLSSGGSHKSITISYMGYKKQTINLRPGQEQVINVRLEEDAENLREVVITPGKKKWENPAHPIIRQAAKNKDLHNRSSLAAYEYEAYSKVEVSLQKMTEKTEGRKLVQKIRSAYDSIHRYTNEEGEALMPIFLSESISRLYFRSKPQMMREHIMHTNVRGIGIEDGSILSQILGTSFQQYNFHEDWMTILGKEFVSPIGDSWKIYYDYELQDSTRIGEDMCYRIKVAPKRKQDLAFYGTIWITKKDYALKQLDVQVLPEANLNFVHKIIINQQLMPTDSSAWIPEKTRVVIDVRQPGDIGSGLLAKFYISAKEPTINKAYDIDFYSNPLSVDHGADKAGADFWSANRHDSLTYDEEKVVQMIDSANKLPAVRRTIGAIRIIGSGFVKVSPQLELGPWPSIYAFNNIEGHRFGLGFRTANTLSRNFRIRGLLAYGTRDNRLKYRVYMEQILNRSTWTRMRIYHNYDLEQVGMDAEDINGANYLFYSFSKLGRLRMPYYHRQTGMLFQRDLVKGITGRITFNHRYYSPAFPFQYRETASTADPNINFSTSEVTLEARITRRETFIQTNFDRISTGTRGWPIVTLRYGYGIPKLLGSDFKYHRLGLLAEQQIKIGFLGLTTYNLEMGKYFGTLPFPLLEVHLGNESPISALATYNLMNLAEFASDTYASLRVKHSFDGLFLNRIPLMRKLKWREVAYGSVLWGELSEANRNMVSPEDPADTHFIQPSSLGHVPYVEVGYGIENIFKFFRLDAFHRLTHLDKPDVRAWGVKVGFAFEL